MKEMQRVGIKPSVAAPVAARASKQKRADRTILVFYRSGKTTWRHESDGPLEELTAVLIDITAPLAAISKAETSHAD